MQPKSTSLQIKLLVVGKNADSNIESMVKDYSKRLNKYIKFSVEYLVLKKKPSDVKKLKEEEGKRILETIGNSSIIVLLDERGQEFHSKGFSDFIQKRMNAAPKEIVFCIGGAYGFSEEVYSKANHQLALSQMTLTHQMVRLLAIEQIYRAFTIIKGEKYHH